MGFKVDPEAGVFPAGLCLVEVVEAEDKQSRKSGDGMFKVKLRDVHRGVSFYENWMMQGPGARMSVPKLKALGLDLERDIEASDLLKRRMVAEIKHKDNGDFGLQSQIAKCWPTDNPPAEWLPIADAREAAAIEKSLEDEPF